MVFKVGEGVGSFYRYKVLGIWQYSEKETAALFGCEPGDIKLDLPSVKKDGNGYYYMNPEGERVDITAENPYGVRADYDRQVIGRNTRTGHWALRIISDTKILICLSSFMHVGGK